MPCQSLSKDSSQYGRGKTKKSQGPRRCKDDTLKEVIGTEVSNGIVKSLTVEDLFQLIQEALDERIARGIPPGGGG